MLGMELVHFIGGDTLGLLPAERVDALLALQEALSRPLLLRWVCIPIDAAEAKVPPHGLPIAEPSLAEVTATHALHLRSFQH